MVRRLNWRAILVGFAVDYGCSRAAGLVMGIGLGVVLGTQGHNAAEAQRIMTTSVPILATFEAVGSFFTVVGGFIAARMAKRDRYWNTAVMALADIVLALPNYGKVPLWCDASAIAVVLPCAWLGAFLAGFFIPPERQSPTPPG